MSVTANQLELIKRINEANRNFWATPEANLTQAAIAEEQAEAAKRFREQADVAQAATKQLKQIKSRDKKKVKLATTRKRYLGNQTRERIKAEVRNSKFKSQSQAAREIAPKIKRSVSHTLTLLKELGLPKVKK